MAKRSIAIALAASGVGMLPVALTGALVVQIRAEFAISLDAYGIVVAAFFVSFGLSSRVFGSVADRWGAIKSLRFSSALLGAALVVLGVAWSPWVLSFGLLVAGIGNGLAQPGANRLLSRTISGQRLGTAFGLKQASVPMAGTFAGLSVPVFGLGPGWRWAFLTAAGIAWLLAVLTYAVRVHARTFVDAVHAPQDLQLNMTRLTIGAGLGALATAPLATFLIDSAVTLGITPSFAGFLLAFSSGAGMGSRIVAGLITDKWPPKNQFTAVGAMLVTGALGFIALALGRPAVFVGGAVLAYVAGWSWNGVFHHGVVRFNDGAPGQATGVVQTGLALGAALGPLVFGFVVESQTYAMGWLLMGAAAAAGGAVVWSATSAAAVREGSESDLRGGEGGS